MFLERARTTRSTTGGSLCVGLDAHPERIPDSYGKTVRGMRRFLMDVVKETVPHASVFKPNCAFFEAHGSEGLELLGDIIEVVHDFERPVILDAKRGDIASTAQAYARAALDVLGVEAITIVPYMGEDAVLPFLDRGLFVFVLTLPSNPSADAVVFHGDPPLFERIARLSVILADRYPDQVGLVVGATRPSAARRLQEIAPDLPWLVPGVGAQGGRPEDLRAGLGASQEAWINVSRAVLFADSPAAAAASWKAEIGVWAHD